MFTVAYHKDGSESFFEAEAVVYYGPFSNRQQTGGLCIEVVQPDKTFDLIGGVAYVMNEGGATVGKYDLGGITAGGGMASSVGVPR